jgi:hypothetical protein
MTSYPETWFSEAMATLAIEEPVLITPMMHHPPIIHTGQRRHSTNSMDFRTEKKGRFTVTTTRSSYYSPRIKSSTRFSQQFDLNK